MTISLRVVVYSDGTKWHAQCLEKHIFASSKNIQDLPELLALTIQCEMDRDNSLPISQAPQRYFDMWNKDEAKIKAKLDPDENYMFEVAA